MVGGHSQPDHEPAVHLDARRLLMQNGTPAKTIVRVDRDSILFINRLDEPRTAWLTLNAGRMSITLTEGFTAEPPKSDLDINRSEDPHSDD